MDNGLRFPYHQGLFDEVGTQKDEKSAPLVERVQAGKLEGRQIRPLNGRPVMGMELSTKASEFKLSRKATRET